MRNRKPKRDTLDDFANIVIGALFGALGGLVSWRFLQPLLFQGDLVVAGALIGGACGLFGGTAYLRNLRDETEEGMDRRGSGCGWFWWWW